MSDLEPVEGNPFAKAGERLEAVQAYLIRKSGEVQIFEVSQIDYDQPIDPGVWQLELDAFRWQIDTWCQRCGVCLPLQGRLDKEMRDDVSPTNLEELRRLGSPRIAEGRFVLFEGGLRDGAWAPLRYLRQEA